MARLIFSAALALAKPLKRQLSAGSFRRQSAFTAEDFKKLPAWRPPLKASRPKRTAPTSSSEPVPRNPGRAAPRLGASGPGFRETGGGWGPSSVWRSVRCVAAGSRRWESDPRHVETGFAARWTVGPVGRIVTSQGLRRTAACSKRPLKVQPCRRIIGARVYGLCICGISLFDACRHRAAAGERMASAPAQLSGCRDAPSGDCGALHTSSHRGAA